MLPNYASVEGAGRPRPISTAAKFHIAAEDSFDPFIFPFIAFRSELAEVEGQESSWGGGVGGYGKRYATIFADNAMSNFMTTGVLPTLLHQDPRYFELGKGRPWRRAKYAATRSFVTLGRSGHLQFNYSEVAGNGITAALSNLYHPSEDRSWSGTLSRFATQMVWDTLFDELKEFWPDIRRMMHKR